MEFAQMILDRSWNHSLSDEEDEDAEDNNMDELFPDKMVFSEFDEYAQGDIRSAIEEDISDLIFSLGDLPKDKDKQDILKFICRHMAFGYGQTLVLNKELNDLFDVILKELVEELEKEDSEDL